MNANEIMKLADAYATEAGKYPAIKSSPIPLVEARAALQSALEAMQAEAERDALQSQLDDYTVMMTAKCDALQAKLTNLQKQEPVGEVVEGVGPRLYKLEDRCKWGMPLYASPKALDIGGQPT